MNMHSGSESRDSGALVLDVRVGFLPRLRVVLRGRLLRRKLWKLAGMKQPVMLLLLRMSVAVVGAAFVAGCKPKPPVEPTAAATAAPADRAEAVTSSASDPRIEACTIRMTAPEAHEWTTWWDPKGVALSGEGPSSAHSFYWASQKEKETLRANKTAMPLDINCRLTRGVLIHRKGRAAGARDLFDRGKVQR